MTTTFREKVRAAIDAYTSTVPIGRQGIAESRLVSKLRMLLQTPEADPTTEPQRCRHCGRPNEPYGVRGETCCTNSDCPVGLSERSDIIAQDF